MTGVQVVMAYAGVAIWLIQRAIGLAAIPRVDAAAESVGLDIAQHGEMLSPNATWSMSSAGRTAVRGMAIDDDSQIQNTLARMVMPMRRECGRQRDVQQFLHDVARAREGLGEAMASQHLLPHRPRHRPTAPRHSVKRNCAPT